MTEQSVMVRALRDQVIVRRDKPKDVVGAIQVVESAKEIPYTGTVLSLGPDVVSRLEEGERVVFSKYAGQPIPGEDGVISMSDRELLCVIPAEGGA